MEKGLTCPPQRPLPCIVKSPGAGGVGRAGREPPSLPRPCLTPLPPPQPPPSRSSSTGRVSDNSQLGVNLQLWAHTQV